MRLSETAWRQYKSDFLRANHCTAQEFESAYVAFAENKPDLAAYQRFARKWKIRIIPEPRLPYQTQVVLSVNIAAIKVMAETETEARLAVEGIVGKRKDGKNEY